MLITINPSIVISGGPSYMVTTRGLLETSTAFVASYGTGTKTWSISPTISGITIDTYTGIVTIAATTAANNAYLETVTATDSVSATANFSLTIRVNPEIAVTGGSNITTTAGIAMSSSAFVAANGSTAANGGTGTYTFSLSPVTQYIHIDSSTGIVTVDTGLTPGTYYETVVATDSLNQTGTKSMSILANQYVVVAGGSDITTTHGISRSTSAFTKSLGTGTLTFTVTDTATGYMSISSSGVVTVDSSTPAGTYHETVTATDTVGAIGVKAFTVYVNADVQIGGGSNILTTVGRADSSTAFTGSAGTPGYTFSISPNYSAYGITLNTTTGVVSVSSSATPGYYIETITVTDSVTAKASETMSVRVNVGVTVGSGSGITTTSGIARSSSAFVASGGTTAATNGSGAFTYALSPIRSGISIDTNSGIVTVDSSVAAGTYQESVVATDSLGLKGYVNMTILVNPFVTVTMGSNITTTHGFQKSSSAFQSANGTGTRTFSIARSNGTQPAGITIDPTSGIVTSDSTTPAGTYIETVTATDGVNAFGTETMTILVNGDIAIGGGSNILTTVLRADSSTAFSVTGGTSPYSYSISPSNNTGITINSTSGVIYVGTNTPAGTYIETVTVQDAVGATSSETMTVRVNVGVSISGGSNITTTYGVSLSSQPFVAAGGTTAATNGSGTFTYSLSPSNPHISINSSGVITVDSSLAASSTPYVETVIATDSLGMKGYFTETITVHSAIVVSGGSNVTTTQGTQRTSTAFTATLGTGTLLFSIARSDGGIQPTGITINATSGVVTVDSSVAAGTYLETVTATDSVGATTSVSMTVLVNGPLQIGGGQVFLYTTHGRAATSSQFTKTGGTTPWAFSILPYVAGITIDTTSGVITVSAATLKGDYFETVTVTDSVNATSAAAIEINVNDSITVSAGVSTIHTTHGIAMYSTAFTAAGGSKSSNGRDATGTLTFTLNPNVSGISIDTNSGIVYVDSSTLPGVYIESVTAADSLGQIGVKLLTVWVETSVAISGGSGITTTHGVALNSSTYNVAYGINTTNGGTAYSYSITDTPTYFSVVTTGLSTFQVRVDSSTPANTYHETVTVTDSVGDTATVSLTILVNPSMTLSGATNIITTYNRADTASAITVATGTGTGTKTFSFTPLPGTSYITIDAGTGVVHALAGLTAGTYNETITATDSVGATATITMSILVNPAIVVSGGSNITTTHGIGQRSTAFTATGGTIAGTGGTGQLVFGLTSSPSSTYITIDTASGVVTVDSQTLANGTSAQVYHETITAMDSLGVIGYTYETITVNPSVTITGGSAIVTTYGIAMNSAGYIGHYGTGAIAFTMVVSPTPTAGSITIDSTSGVLTATSSVPAGTYYETITAKDSVGDTAVVVDSVLVNAAITLGQLQNIYTTQGRADSTTIITASGGTSPITYTETTTPSASGITINANTCLLYTSPKPTRPY